MTTPQTQRSLSNVCLFCNETLNSPSMCKFCGFKFCNEHLSTEGHQCIKTRYLEYIKRTQTLPNLSSGKFRVSCEVCGYVSKKPTAIEYAGEDLIQHTQLIGCTGNIFLEEINSHEDLAKQIDINQNETISKITPKLQKNNDAETKQSTTPTSIVEQILKVASLKENGMISEEEFIFIKKELISKLK